MDNTLITAYLAMPYRGALGDKATDEDIADNVELAKEIAFAIQSHFPQHLQVYLPHIDPALQQYQRRDDGTIVGSDEILDRCCDIVASKDLFIYCGDAVGGVRIEKEVAEAWGIPVVHFPLRYTDADFERIAVGIWKANERKLSL